MGQKLNKVEGEKASCPTCTAPIICVKVQSGNYPVRLTWQDLNPETGQSLGQAHYNIPPPSGSGPYVCAGSVTQNLDSVPASKRIEAFKCESIVPTIAPNDNMTVSARIFEMALSVAQQETIKIYPKLDRTTRDFDERFLKFTELILDIYNSPNK